MTISVITLSVHTFEQYYAQANLRKMFVMQNPNYEIRTTELHLLLFTASDTHGLRWTLENV